MEKKVSCFGEKHIIKNKFHIHEGSISINGVDIERIELLKKESYGNKGSYKYFMDLYKGTALPSSLCIKLPQMNSCIK